MSRNLIIRRILTLCACIGFVAGIAAVSNACLTTVSQNDEVEIQAAIDSLPPEGGRVELEQKTYLLSSGINITRDNVHLQGQGRGTNLKLKDKANVDTPLIRIEASNIEISDLAIDGNKANNPLGYGTMMTGVYLVQASDVTLRRLYIQGANWDGVVITGSQDILVEDVHAYNNGTPGEGEANFNISGFESTISKRVTLTRCISESSGRVGYEIEDGAEDILIEDSESISDTSAGFYVHNHEGNPANKRITFQNVSVLNSGGGFSLYGFDGFPTEDVKVINSTSTDSNGGILLNLVTRALIEGNSITVQAGAGTHGIRAIESSEVTIADNTLDIGTGNDIAIAGGDIITGNRAIGAVTRIGPSSGAIVSDNEGWIFINAVSSVEVTNNRGLITLKDASDCTIEENYSTAEITLDSSSYNIIRNNVAGGTDSYGIHEVGNADYNTITGNDVRASIYTPKIVIVGAHTEVYGNIGYPE